MFRPSFATDCSIAARAGLMGLYTFSKGALDRISPWRWSIRASTVALVLTIALPLNLVILAVIWKLADASDEAQRAGLLFTARSVSAAVDAELGKYAAVAQALSRSPALLAGDLEAFEIEVQRALPDPANAWAVVADPEGQQVLNQARRPGQQLIRRTETALAGQRQAFETGNMIISDIFLDPISNDWVINLEYPVFKDGRPFRSFAVNMRASQFYKFLNASDTPRNWLTGIIDHEGRFIARVPENERRVGSLASEDWRTVRERAGTFTVTSLEGDRTILANARSGLTDWAIGVSIREAELRGAVWRSVRWALWLGGGLSALSLLLAALTARRIMASIVDLERGAAILLNGGKATLKPGLPETGRVWDNLRDLAAQRRQADDALRLSEARLTAALKAGNLGVHEYDLLTGLIYWDAAIRELWGVPESTAVTYEMFESGVEPGDIDMVRAAIERAFDPAGPGHFEAEYRVRNRLNGVVRWVFADGEVTFEGGQAVRLVGTVRDITGRKQAEEALRRGEERYRLALRTGGLGAWELDFARKTRRWTPEGMAIFGIDLADGIGRVGGDGDELRARMVNPQLLDHFHELALTEDHFAAEYQIAHPEKGVRWVSGGGLVLERDSAGRPLKSIHVAGDITERRDAEERLQAVSAQMAQTLDIAATGITRCNRDLRYISANRAYAELLRRPADEIINRPMIDVLGAEAFETVRPYIERVLAGERVEFEIALTLTNRSRVIHAVYVPDIDRSGAVRGWVASISDVTERRRAEEQLKIVMHEVNHRSKNMLTMVLAIARRTASTEPKDFVKRFESRIRALSASQDLLVKSEWRGVAIDELVRSQLAHFQDVVDPRLTLQGPPVKLTAAAAQTIGMALHELATNAGKYGALSVDHGGVEITWNIEHRRGERPKLSIIWKEYGGPPVSPPPHRGFGWTVICDFAAASLDADVSLDFAVTGVVWRLSCPAQGVCDAYVPEAEDEAAFV